MKGLKLFVVLMFASFGFAACLAEKRNSVVIAESKSYEATLFKQHCSICHGPEGNGRTLDNSTKVPSLREGEFKAVTEAAIENQIANGGNGMLPFRNTLTKREIDLMTGFVYHDLRGN